MANDDMRCAGILQHLRRNIASMGAGLLEMAILAADAQGFALDGLGCSEHERCRDTDQCIDFLANGGIRPVDDHAQFVERLSRAIHFPVTSNERADVRGHWIFLS